MFERYMNIEWAIMRSIMKHGGAALVPQIFGDLRAKSYPAIEILEGIARLMETKIIHFSLDQFDFLFEESNKLTKAVQRKTKPTISIDEYESYGWTKLAAQ